MNKKIFLFTRYEENRDNPEFAKIWNFCNGRRKKVFEFNSNSANSTDKLYVVPFYRIRNELQNERKAEELFLRVKHFLGHLLSDGMIYCLIHMRNPDLFKSVNHYFTFEYPEIYVSKYSTTLSSNTEWYEKHIKEMAENAIFENGNYSVYQKDFDRLWDYFEFKLNKEFLEDLRASNSLDKVFKNKKYSRILKLHLPGSDKSIGDFIQFHLQPENKGENFESYRMSRNRVKEFLLNKEKG